LDNHPPKRQAIGSGASQHPPPNAEIFGGEVSQSCPASLKRNAIGLNHRFALVCCLTMIFSDLPPPAEASNESGDRFAWLRAGKKPVSTPDQVRAGVFGIML
jgi:hypothetical protein